MEVIPKDGGDSSQKDLVPYYISSVDLSLMSMTKYPE